ncbi:MAG: YgdI/YgdR family lipoprotein [Verrucomicrobiales bacterium]|nr:YgdI/YgdR family lipoprotein [Verrucomicrobiales bacterium]
MSPFRVLCSALLLGAVLSTAGCSGRYIITTTSGAKIVTANKPKLVQSKYVYKDGSGQVVEISTMRVRVIEPYSKRSAGRQLSRPELQ